MLQLYGQRIIVSFAIAQNSVVRCDFFPISAIGFERGRNSLGFPCYSQTTVSEKLCEAVLLIIFSVAFVLQYCSKLSYLPHTQECPSKSRCSVSSIDAIFDGNNSLISTNFPAVIWPTNLAEIGENPGPTTKGCRRICVEVKGRKGLAKPA